MFSDLSALLELIIPLAAWPNHCKPAVQEKIIIFLLKIMLSFKIHLNDDNKLRYGNSFFTSSNSS